MSHVDEFKAIVRRIAIKYSVENITFLQRGFYLCLWTPDSLKKIGDTPATAAGMIIEESLGKEHGRSAMIRTNNPYCIQPATSDKSRAFQSGRDGVRAIYKTLEDCFRHRMFLLLEHNKKAQSLDQGVAGFWTRLDTAPWCPPDDRRIGLQRYYSERVKQLIRDNNLQRLDKLDRELIKKELYPSVTKKKGPTVMSFLDSFKKLPELVKIVKEWLPVIQEILPLLKQIWEIVNKVEGKHGPGTGPAKLEEATGTVADVVGAPEEEKGTIAEVINTVVSVANVLKLLG